MTTHQAGIDPALASAAATIDYRTPGHAVKVPNYGAIVTGASVLRAAAVLSYLVALLSIVIGVITFVQAIQRQASFSSAWLLAIVPIVSGIGSFVSGLILHMLAHIGLAVRDIARNSFSFRR